MTPANEPQHGHCLVCWAGWVLDYCTKIDTGTERELTVYEARMQDLACRVIEQLLREGLKEHAHDGHDDHAGATEPPNSGSAT